MTTIEQPIPKHLQLRNFLRDEIERRRQAGQEEELMPSERDLIHRFGVSSTTARRAINDLVSEGLLYRRQGKGTFINTATKTTRANRLVGVLIPSHIDLSTDPYVMAILEGMRRGLRGNGYDLLLTSHEPNLDDPFGGTEPAGVFAFFPRENDAELLNKIVNVRRLAAVALNSTSPGVNISQVCFDNLQATYEAVQHLLELGHRRIAYIGDPLHSTSKKDRYQGYCEALSDAGLTVTPDWVQLEHPDVVDGGRAATEALLNGEERPTAIVANNDEMAIGALLALRERAIAVPEEMSVVGFDGRPTTAQTVPPLTTVACNLCRMGSEAANLLLSQMNDANAMPTTKMLPTRLLIRESTAPPQTP